jgi:S-adenosylhomocysteine hydrolase
VLVVGQGPVGKGIAERARDLGAIVQVADTYAACASTESSSAFLKLTAIALPTSVCANLTPTSSITI